MLCLVAASLILNSNASNIIRTTRRQAKRLYVVSVVLAIEVGQRARVEERVSGLFFTKTNLFPS